MATNVGWDIDKILKDLNKLYESEGIKDNWNTEHSSLKIALQAILSSFSDSRYSHKETLAVGGSGILLRLADRLFPKIDKVLKFPRPVQGKIKLIAEMLEKEISYLADLKHPGIVRIVYYKILQNIEIYGSLPYYLMEFIDGSKSKYFLQNNKTTEKQLFVIVSRVAEIIAYLHAANPEKFAHLDIKPENIMIGADDQPVIIDLGTCKRLRAEDTHTIIACTRPYAHPQLVQMLSDDPTDDKRAKGEIPRSAIKPSWDLWAFGLTLIEWLGINRNDGRVAENAIYQRLTPYTRKYYMLLAARLLSYGIPHWLMERVGISHTFLREFSIDTAEDLLEIILRLDGSRNPLRGIEELSDPSSGSIQVAPGMYEGVGGRIF